MVFLWSTCESVIGRLWTDHVLPSGSGIFGRKRFVEGNGWSAAHKVEVLFQRKMIDDALYADINLARTSRNSLAHHGETPGLNACKAALSCAFRLVALVRSGGARQDEFSGLTDRLASLHDRRSGPIDAKYWRELPAVPGDNKWGDAPYPIYPEIELKPVKPKRV